MLFKKGDNSSSFFKKGSSALHLGIKGIANLADHPLAGVALSATNPGLLSAYGAVKNSGILQKLKQ